MFTAHLNRYIIDPISQYIICIIDPTLSFWNQCDLQLLLACTTLYDTLYECWNSTLTVSLKSNDAQRGAPTKLAAASWTALLCIRNSITTSLRSASYPMLNALYFTTLHHTRDAINIHSLAAFRGRLGAQHRWKVFIYIETESTRIQWLTKKRNTSANSFKWNLSRARPLSGGTPRPDKFRHLRETPANRVQKDQRRSIAKSINTVRERSNNRQWRGVLTHDSFAIPQRRLPRNIFCEDYSPRSASAKTAPQYLRENSSAIFLQRLFNTSPDSTEVTLRRTWSQPRTHKETKKEESWCLQNPLVRTRTKYNCTCLRFLSVWRPVSGNERKALSALHSRLLPDE